MISGSRITILSAMAVLFSGCVTTLESRWHEPSSVPQSNPENYQYDTDAGMMYLFSNTTDSLFVDLKFPDHITARKVRQAGLTLWLDPEAKNNRTYGIRFPLPGKRNHAASRRHVEMPEVVEGEDGFKRLRYPEGKAGNERAELIRENLEMQLIGFGEEREGPVMPLHNSTIKLRLYYDENNILSYHMALPLNKIADNHKVEDNPLSIGIVTGHLQRPDQNRDMTRRQPGAGGGRRGGMMPGNYYGQRQNRQHDYSRLFSSTQIWIKKVWLATKDHEQSEN